MDPFYGYTDNNYTGTGASGDQPNPNDPNQYNWASQWSAPASAQQQASGGQFPQYVSPQQQQAQQQAQQTFAAMNPNSLSNFMQQQQKSQQQQQFQQKIGQHGPIGAPKPPQPSQAHHPHHHLGGGHSQSNPRSFGAFGAVGGGGGSGGNFGRGGGVGAPGGLLAQEWITPASAASSQQVQYGMGGGAGLRTFPSKSGGGGGPGGNRPHWKQQKGPRQVQQPAGPKKMDTAGKTPAMILHELFKEVKEAYSEVDESNPKRYRCTLTVNGRDFQMDSPNKKTSKQKCAELVVRELRPDINVTPFGEGAAPKAQAPAAKRNAQENIPSVTPPPAKKSASGNGNAARKTKEKIKLTPVEGAMSLNDLMMRLIAERGPDNKLTPVYEAVELPGEAKESEESEDQPTDVVKQENPEDVQPEPLDPDEQKAADEEGASKKKKHRKSDKDRVRRPEVLVQYTLKFAEIGKEYVKVGPNRQFLKDLVVREALRDFFQVSEADIAKVATRYVQNKLTRDMNLSQCLFLTCGFMNCKVTMEVEPAEDRPLGEGRSYYMAKVTLTDHNNDGKVTEIKSASCPSKVLAKEHAAQEVLKQYFNIDPNSINRENVNSAQQGPAALLHAMMNKKTQQKTKIDYEFKDNVPAVAGVKQTEPVFYCDCVIDTERYTGQARSKKLAKNAAAVVALKKKFDIDYDPEKAYPLAQNIRPEQMVSPLCAEIAEFCKREYHRFTDNFQVPQSNFIAAFVLINEANNKRLISVASCSQQYVVEPDNLNGANGNHIIHFDPVILARRGLLRYLNEEILCANNEAASIFERKEDGRYALKPNLKLVLYSNFSPVVQYSADDAHVKSLSMIKHISLQVVPSETLDVHDIRKKKELRIHCTADKLFKWNTLGVQGGLFSNVMHPMFISHIFFGSQMDVSDDSLKFALCNRLGEAAPEGVELNLESIPVQMHARSAQPHLWYRGFDQVETLCLNTGRTANGTPSKVCKAEIFESYLRLPNTPKGEEVNYAKEKERAANYQYEKKVFYNKLEAAGLGKWQQKPAELADDFTLRAPDAE